MLPQKPPSSFSGPPAGTLSYYYYYYYLVYLFLLERRQWQRERERESQADFLLSVEPHDLGLNLMTLTSDLNRNQELNAQPTESPRRPSLPFFFLVMCCIVALGL